MLAVAVLVTRLDFLAVDKHKLLLVVIVKIDKVHHRQTVHVRNTAIFHIGGGAVTLVIFLNDGVIRVVNALCGTGSRHHGGGTGEAVQRIRHLVGGHNGLFRAQNGKSDTLKG